MTRATHTPRLTGGDAGITTIPTRRKRCRACSIERCAHQDQLWAPVGCGGPAGPTHGRGLACQSPTTSIWADSMQNINLLDIRGRWGWLCSYYCRQVNRTIVSTSYQLGMRCQWGGQRKTAIISFGITRGEGINCCEPDERFRDLKQPKENTICE